MNALLLRDADYPGIVPDAEHTVRGTYVTGLTEANLVKLDFFEGSEYDRLPVKVKLLEKVGDDKGEGNVEGAEVETSTYVFKDKALLEDKEWDFDHFRNERMKHWTREDYCFSGRSCRGVFFFCSLPNVGWIQEARATCAPFIFPERPR